MNEDDVIAELRQFLHQNDRADIVGEDQPLDLDSFLTLLVITYAKEEMGVTLDTSTLDFEAFSTLRTLADLIVQTGRNPQ